MDNVTNNLTINFKELIKGVPDDAVPWICALLSVLHAKPQVEDKQISRDDLIKLIQDERVEVSLRLTPKKETDND